MRLISLQGDLAPSAEFVPGYSSFLFNQLLQTQFEFNYSVNNGGLSININLADGSRNYTNPINNAISSSLSHVISAGLKNSNDNITSPKLAHTTKNVNKNNTNSNVKSNNVHNNNNKDNNDDKMQYESYIFQELISNQREQDKLMKQFEIPSKHIPMYPEIDLMEFFDEKELIRRNKKRLEELLYAPNCNLGIFIFLFCSTYFLFIFKSYTFFKLNHIYIF